MLVHSVVLRMRRCQSKAKEYAVASAQARLTVPDGLDASSPASNLLSPFADNPLELCFEYFLKSVEVDGDLVPGQVEQLMEVLQLGRVRIEQVRQRVHER